MNELQKTYLVAKTAYDLAFENQNWELVDQLEDPMLEAEFALIDWTFEVAEASGLMKKEDIEFLRRHMTNEHIEKIADMGMRLKA